MCVAGSEVSVVIPAYNEAERIAGTVRACRSIPGVVEVIVVDDGSGDRTGDVAGEVGACVVQLSGNKGKGRAMEEGLRRACGDLVVFLDADLGASAAEAIKLIEPVLSGEADLTIARFGRAAAPGGFGFVRGLARGAVRLLGGADISCVLSGQRAALRNTFLSLLPFAPGFGVETAMTLDALRRGLAIKEVDVDMTHAHTGRDLRGFLHRGRQFSDVLRSVASRCWIAPSRGKRS